MLLLTLLMAWRHFRWRAHILRSERLIAVSASVAEEVSRFAPSAADKVTVVPNGVSLQHFRPNESTRIDIRGKLNIPLESSVMITAGRLAAEKGTHLAIEAMKKIEDGTAHLLILGEGEDRARLEQLSRAENLSGRVHFTGFVPHDELPAYLSAADLFLMPTLRQEGLPITLVESLAAGLPVVASNIGGIRAAVEHQKQGMLFPLGELNAFVEQLELLLSGHELRKKLARAAREKAEKCFDVDKMIERTEEIFLSAAGKGVDEHSAPGL